MCVIRPDKSISLGYVVEDYSVLGKHTLYYDEGI